MVEDEFKRVYRGNFSPSNFAAMPFDAITCNPFHAIKISLRDTGSHF